MYSYVRENSSEIIVGWACVALEIADDILAVGLASLDAITELLFTGIVDIL